MDYQLQGRVALVNAASRGIGRAIAEALAAEGVRVVISSRNQEEIDRAAREIAAAHGAQVVGAAADVTDPGAAGHLVTIAVQRFGALDILVNNSGGPPFGTFTDHDDAAWQQAFDLLLLSVVRMVRAALPHLRASGRGRIVNVESTSVKEPLPGLILSNSLRAGRPAWPRPSRPSWLPTGSRCTTCCPDGSSPTGCATCSPRRPARPGRTWMTWSRRRWLTTSRWTGRRARGHGSPGGVPLLGSRLLPDRPHGGRLTAACCAESLNGRDQVPGAVSG